MTNYSTLASNMKRRIIRFSERIAKGLNRPVYKFVSQMITGMLSSQSCHLSKIARTLGEPISLKKTIDRLSRNLSSFEKGAHLQENYMQQVKACLNDRSILVVDDGDITKPCSTKLEGLCKVRDGSTGEIGVGYYMYEATALTPGQGTPISVYSRVFSTEEEGFVSADMEVLNLLRYLGRHFKKNIILAFDRGFDANVYYEHLLGQDERFVIRAKKNRDLIHKGERINILEVAKKYKGKYSLRFLCNRSGMVD